jgi:hypothetical protein
MTIVNDKAEKRHKRGDVREDGMIFWVQKKGKEYWYTPEKFEHFRAQHAAKANKYYYLHREAHNACCKKWAEKNKDRCKEVSQKWAERNREKVRSIAKKFRERHRARVNEKNKLWRKNNPDKYLPMKRSIEARRRAKKGKALSELTNAKKRIIDCFYEQAQRLQKRLGVTFHVDHIVPLSRGGKHEPANLQVLPARLNMKKHAKETWRWEELQLN